MNLLLFIVAWLLILPLTVWNLIVVYQKNGNVKGYFRGTALSLDIWANKEFRTLWNTQLRIASGYKFGNFNETISSALGKNERDKTLSKKGKLLVKIQTQTRYLINNNDLSKKIQNKEAFGINKIIN